MVHEQIDGKPHRVTHRISTDSNDERHRSDHGDEWPRGHLGIREDHADQHHREERSTRDDDVDGRSTELEPFSVSLPLHATGLAPFLRGEPPGEESALASTVSTAPADPPQQTLHQSWLNLLVGHAVKSWTNSSNTLA